MCSPSTTVYAWLTMPPWSCWTSALHGKWDSWIVTTLIHFTPGFKEQSSTPTDLGSMLNQIAGVPNLQGAAHYQLWPIRKWATHMHTCRSTYEISRRAGLHMHITSTCSQAACACPCALAHHLRELSYTRTCMPACCSCGPVSLSPSGHQAAKFGYPCAKGQRRIVLTF